MTDRQAIKIIEKRIAKEAKFKWAYLDIFLPKHFVEYIAIKIYSDLKNNYLIDSREIKPEL